jgi:F-type H+-transporting ATPase subunit delta
MTERPSVPSVLDPQARRLGRVYAEALLDSLPEPDQAEPFAEALRGLAGLLADLPGAKEILAGHSLSRSQREAMVRRIFATRVSKPMEAFLGVLAANHRLQALPVIAAQFDQLLKERAGRLTVDVRSAQPLDDNRKAHLRNTLAEALDADVELDCQVDETLLGGLLVQVGDVVYDASLAGDLACLRAKLIEGNGPA